MQKSTISAIHHDDGGYVFVADDTGTITLDSIDYFDKKTRLSDALQQGFNILPYAWMHDAHGWYPLIYTSASKSPFYYSYDGKTDILITIINAFDANKFGVVKCAADLCATVTVMSAK